MEIRCSICDTLRNPTSYCSGCMSKREREPRIPPGVDILGYDLDDWQYFYLIELILAGGKLNEYEYNFLQILPSKTLTRKEAEDMCEKRIKRMQGKAEQRHIQNRQAIDKETKRHNNRLF